MSEKSDKNIVGKWIDVSTEQTVEYTESGFYYEYINENFTADKTRYKKTCSVSLHVFYSKSVFSKGSAANSSLACCRIFFSAFVVS